MRRERNPTTVSTKTNSIYRCRSVLKCRHITVLTHRHPHTFKTAHIHSHTHPLLQPYTHPLTLHPIAFSVEITHTPSFRHIHATTHTLTPIHTHTLTSPHMIPISPRTHSYSRTLGNFHPSQLVLSVVAWRLYMGSLQPQKQQFVKIWFKTRLRVHKKTLQGVDKGKIVLSKLLQ